MSEPPAQSPVQSPLKSLDQPISLASLQHVESTTTPSDPSLTAKSIDSPIIAAVVEHEQTLTTSTVQPSSKSAEQPVVPAVVQTGDASIISPVPRPVNSAGQIITVPLHHVVPVTLTHTTEVREATIESPNPSATDRKYAGTSSVQTGYAKEASLAILPKGSDISVTDHAACPSEGNEIPDRAQSTDLRPSLAAPVIPAVSPELHHKPTTELRAGMIQKPFYVHSDLLVSKSPYFADMQNKHSNPQPSHRLSGPFFFSDLDEFAFALFVRWIYGGDLHGPNDFHSMHHYLCLYVLARRFRVELLENHVMDLVREYYRLDDMTAPPFRLEYIYNSTEGSCLMRDFLVSTAAYRTLADAEKGAGLSESMCGILKKGGDLSVDFPQAICALVQNDRQDVRHGNPCRFHEHELTKRCHTWAGFEPWETG